VDGVASIKLTNLETKPLPQLFSVKDIGKGCWLIIRL